AHPFSVSPAIRTEKSDLLSLQTAFTFLKHRGELCIFQLFVTHRRAAKGNGIILSHFAAGKSCRFKNFHFCPCILHSLLYFLGHSLCIASSTPVYNCCFHIHVPLFKIFSMSSSHDQLPHRLSCKKQSLIDLFTFFISAEGFSA